MKAALVIGGSNGIGLAIACKLRDAGYREINILDRDPPGQQFECFRCYRHNLLDDDISVYHQFSQIDTLVVSAGFGRVCHFSSLSDAEITNSFKVNAVAVVRAIRFFYDRICSSQDFYCAVFGSVAGLVSSPLFSVYSATKAAICRFVEGVNIELEKQGTANRILNVCPGRVEGTRFYGGSNDLTLTSELAEAVLSRMFARETLFIPDYQNVYRDVLRRYASDPHQFGLESYDYKVRSGRVSDTPQIKIGYLSGTFDLFHIGHLNLIRRAKQYCDRLVVGVHKDGSHKGKKTFIPYSERVAILSSIRYVDEVIEACPEDSDAYYLVGFDYLFVGSDYRGTERFRRYEEFFKDKSVRIIYFPYTIGTSSTQLRDVLESVARANNP